MDGNTLLFYNFQEIVKKSINKNVHGVAYLYFYTYKPDQILLTYQSWLIYHYNYSRKTKISSFIV